MAKIIVTIPPEMYPVSGTLFEKAVISLRRINSTSGDLVLGFDENFFPIRIGRPPKRGTFDPWILISEDLDYLLISEDSIFADTLQITCIIKADGTGQVFPVDINQEPIVNITPNINNYPNSLSSESQLINVNKNSKVALFIIDAPINSKFTYTLSDITTQNINLFGSFYSVDLGVNWIPYDRSGFIVNQTSYGKVLIYVPISTETQNIGITNRIFLLTASIEDDIVYLTAEYGENPNPAAEGPIITDFVVSDTNIPRRVSGTQNSPIPYGTFRKCLNNSGLAEFYGESEVIITGGVISYSYNYFTSISPLCIK